MKKSVSEIYDPNMSILAGIKHNSLFLIALLVCFQGSAQTVQDDAKIDPAFRTVLTAKKNGRDIITNRNLSAYYSIAPTERLIAGSIPAQGYDCIVYTKKAQALRDSGIAVNSVLPNFVTAWATPDQIRKMAAMPDVLYVKAPNIASLQNDIAVGSTGASLLHSGKLNNTVYKGKNVLIAIFDTGIDWDHPDFRDPADQTKSRILRIWDQTLTPVGSETSPSAGYGVEYTQAQINDELDGTPSNYIREKDINGHGTHVAGTAAGNGSALASKKFMGMAPEADIIVVKGGDSTFSSVNVINAITYLQALATTLGKPIVINLSFGFLLSAHDGSDPEEVTIDQFTASAPGRAVVVAAGNDNGSNLHNRLTLAGSSNVSAGFTVPAVSTGTTVFTYKMYANNSSDLSVTLTAPDGGGTVTAAAGQSSTGTVLNGDFTATLSNAIDIGNGHRYIELAVIRNGINTSSPAGSWLLSVTNNTAAQLTLDGWLRKGTGFTNMLLVGGDNSYMVNSPGNASSAITVASYVGKLSVLTFAGSLSRYTAERQDSISSTSSRGPRRDGVLKPDIAATGHGVVSSLSSDAIPYYTPVITNTGLYHLLQGTSMASAAVAGAAALLFQADPTASARQVKTLLNTTASKDAFTELPGATPNTTWGNGKVDVFKAASSLFNCSPVTRKTYQYDNSNRYSQYFAYYPASTQRLAVRFTPDISGKLGGVFFYTYPVVTGLLLEVRANNGGVPGNLLGTLNIDSISVIRGALNYVDISNLNISVTNAADYFVVLARNPNNSSNWGLIDENVSLDNRSLVSINGGVSWSNFNYDFAIRSVVYANNQTAGALAATSSTDTRNPNTSNSFINSSCGLIAQLVPGGASPVTGTITGRVWLETGVPHYGLDPFVSRHYEITPASNAPGATARVTLYFTQQEFTAFNNDPYSTFNLPAGPDDAAGKANLRVGKYPGSSGDGSGLPATYSEAPVIIDPDDTDIVWNAEYSRWEISFAVSGFSGFILQTKASALPVFIEYFKGKKDRTGNQLSWKINCANASVLYQVERSRDGLNFDSIGSLLTTPVNCSQPLGFTDPSPAPGANYYRIRITENNGTIRYTGVVFLKEDGAITTLYPTVLTRNTTIQVNYAGVKGTLLITDATGKQLYTHTLTHGTQSLALPLRGSGLYFYSIRNDEGKLSGGKITVK